MAHTIGPLIKTVRQAEEITQARLYANVLSRRQAIRFEAGETDISTERLFQLLARLDMTAAEFQYRWEKQTAVAAPPTPQQAILDTAQAKLDQWLDADLTPGEAQAIEAYALTRPFFTLNQIDRLMAVMPKLAPAPYGRITQKLARLLAEMPDAPRVQRRRYSLWANLGIRELFSGEAVQAQKHFAQAAAFAGDSLDDRITGGFNQQLAAALVTGDAANVYAATDAVIAHMRGLGLGVDADSLIDNRRHALTAAGLHARWTPAELGAMARLVMIVPWPLIQDKAAYLRRFPGLQAALDAAGRPLSAFRDVY